MCLKLCIILCCAIISEQTVNGHIQLNWDPVRPAFDPKIYENALHPETCSEQLEYIRNKFVLKLSFLESGMRIPKGLAELNFVDFGNYDQCINIFEGLETSVIEGKYCQIQVPLSTNSVNLAKSMFGSTNWDGFDESILSGENIDKYNKLQKCYGKLEAANTGVDRSRTAIGFPVDPEFRIALCVPKTCTTAEGIAGLLPNFTVTEFEYKELFCRFKNDKPWVPADYVAISLFSLIGLLTILSTTYDIYQTFILKTESKNITPMYRSFSLYTNCKSLTTFKKNPNNLSSVDGVRAISMFWIVISHTYNIQPVPFNVAYAYMEFMYSLSSLWITASPYAVDTFFLLSGMLLVYTSVGKLTSSNLLKNLHIFYLRRLSRMFPLLAALVLLQASLLFRIIDGPDWRNNASNTDACRVYWWATLLHVQNYVNYQDICIRHSWYLAVDVQCYIVSPIVLYWVLGRRRKLAWISLIAGVLATLTIATTYSFIMKFPGWLLGQLREGGEPDYNYYYYFNTLTRAPPFFIGMVIGYILHERKGRQPKIPYFVNVPLWLLSGGAMLTLVYLTHLVKNESWDKWVVDDLVNSLGRSLWVLAIGWIIFACQHGYGGPVNWFLCLDVWKLPSRVSYALYLYHYHLQFMVQGYARQPIYFSNIYALYNFCAQVLISYGIALATTLVIDSPFSVLTKLALDGGIKKEERAIFELS